jgi:hypothetical protein
MTTLILLPAAAASVLGYSERHMRNLLEHGVIKDLVHYAGCTAFYLFTELLIFRRKARIDTELADLIELLKPDEEKD